MRKVMKISLIALVVITVNFSYAQELVSSKIIGLKDKTIIELDHLQKGSQIIIKDVKGFTLYEKKMKGNGSFTKAFDFTNLPNGQYCFELNSKNEIQIIPFNIKNKVAEFDQKAEYNIYKPEIVIENNYAHISKQSSNEEDMDIKVYYNGENLAFEESFNEVKTINRTYDFSSSLEGNYTIILTTEGRSYVDNIDIP